MARSYRGGVENMNTPITPKQTNQIHHLLELVNDMLDMIPKDIDISQLLKSVKEFYNWQVSVLEDHAAQGLLKSIIDPPFKYDTADRDKLFNRIQEYFVNDPYFQLIDYRGVSRWGLHCTMKLTKSLLARYQFYRFEVKPRTNMTHTIDPPKFRQILGTVIVEPEPVLAFISHGHVHYGYFYYFEQRKLFFW